MGGALRYNDGMRDSVRFLWGIPVVALMAACGGAKEPAAPVRSAAQADVERLRPETKLEGRIVFQSDLDGDNDIYVLTAERLTKLTDNAWDDRYPRWSPDGRHIAFSANPKGNFDLFVMDADGAGLTAVTDSPEDELDVAWGPDGQALFFSRSAAGPASRGDSSTWTIDLASGRESEAIRGFRRSNGLADISPLSGDIAFTGKRLLGGWDVFLFDPRAGSVQGLTKGGDACRPRWSPDGRRIAFVSSAADGKGDIWLMSADGSGKTRITERSETYDYFPSWSPDGTRIVFCSNARDKYADKGDWGLYIVDVRDHRVARLLDTPGRDVFPDWR
jgi:Tol biopolymer transport system component